MKSRLLLLLLILFSKVNAQSDSDTSSLRPSRVGTLSKDSSIKASSLKDSSVLYSARKDSTGKDSTVHSYEKLIGQNQYLHLSTPSTYVLIKERRNGGKEYLFYAIAILVLFIGLFKAFYARYFNTIFRVYFNTSLRQNQLTDILLQSKLPSLIFNILFCVTGGVYFWLMLTTFNSSMEGKGFMLLPASILGLGIIYIGKLCFIKFLGWISGTSETADSYIFIIFLINKIIGIFLIPFVILLAFCPLDWKISVGYISIGVAALLFLSRYIRSYELLRRKISIQGFHFLLYLLGAEVIPLVIVAKTILSILG